MSSFSGGDASMVFGILGDDRSLDRTLRDTELRIQRFAANVSRNAVDVPVRIRAEANDFFANRGFVPSGGGRPGPQEGGGGFGRFARGVGGAAAATAVAEGLVEAGSMGVKALGAAADAANGETKVALNKLADLGDQAKKMPGLFGYLSRSVSAVLGEVTGINAAIAKAEKDTKDLDAKSDRMEARNRIARAVNQQFKAISDAEADRTAKENAQTPSEASLVDLNRQRKELQKLIADTNVRGVDKDAAQKALDALQHRETDLRAKAAAERETLERKHQQALTDIMAKGQADRLKAEGYAEAAERAELEARQRAATEALYAELSAERQPAAQKRIIERIVATRAQQEQETAAFEAEQQRKQAERQRQSAEAASDAAREAGEAALKREQQREAVRKDTRDAAFEARQADLRAGGFDERARFEAIRRKAEEELRAAEDPNLREAIVGRQGAELRALLREVNGAPNTRAEVVSDPTRTAFGRGGLGVGDNTAGLKQLDNTLKNDILAELRRITKNTANGQVALTT